MRKAPSKEMEKRHEEEERGEGKGQKRTEVDRSGRWMTADAFH